MQQLADSGQDMDPPSASERLPTLTLHTLTFVVGPLALPCVRIPKSSQAVLRSFEVSAAKDTGVTHLECRPLTVREETRCGRRGNIVFRDVRECLYACLQQREECGLISAPLCPKLQFVQYWLNRLGPLGALQQSGNRKHFVSLAVTEAAVRTSSWTHRSSSRHELFPLTRTFFFCDERFWSRLDPAVLARQRGSLAPCNFHAVVSACSHALVCESPKPWRIPFALFQLTQDG